MKNFTPCDLARCHEQCKKEHKPSSFCMHDPTIVFEALRLKPGDSFLDLGCGVGDYSCYASKIVGTAGTVYAIDKSESLVSDLQKKVESEALLLSHDKLSLHLASTIKNVKPILSDITDLIPLENESVDACMIATVLHILDLEKDGKKLFTEMRRVLKPGGRLITIDCKKKESSFGPPLHMRVSEEEVENVVTPCGFQKTKTIDLGYNYLMQFVAK